MAQLPRAISRSLLGTGFPPCHLRVWLHALTHARKWLFAGSVLLSVPTCTSSLGEALSPGEHQVLPSYFGHWAQTPTLSTAGSECHVPIFFVINSCIITLRGDKSLFREGKVKPRVEMTFFPPFSIQNPFEAFGLPAELLCHCGYTVSSTSWRGKASLCGNLPVSQWLFLVRKAEPWQMGVPPPPLLPVHLLRTCS